MSTKVNRIKFFLSRKVIVVLVSLVAVLMISSLCGAWILSEEKEITLSVNQNESTFKTYTNTVAELLAEQGIDEEDVVSSNPSLYSVIHNGDRITAVVSAEYKIMADGEVITVKSTGKTVADVLSVSGITVGENDEVTPQLDEIAVGNLVINVDRITIQDEIKETVLAYSTEKHKNNTIAAGTEIVTRAGQTGLQTDTYRVKYRNGEFYEEELINSEVAEPISEIVEVGTAGDNYISSYHASAQDTTKNDYKNGYNSENESTASNCIDFAGNSCKQVVTMKATAYHEGTGSLTRSGTLSRVGAIAVDPDVIPLGTKLYVEGYGYCIAEDTGGLIKGNRIDVYLDSEAECEEWGVKSVTVYVLD